MEAILTYSKISPIFNLNLKFSFQRKFNLEEDRFLKFLSLYISYLDKISSKSTPLEDIDQLDHN